MKILNKKAISVIEYSVLMIIIIGAFLVMRNYIQRGIYGHWAKSGQSFAFGRQYDPQKTIDCAYDQTTGNWYDYNCYRYYNANGGCDLSTACGGQCVASYCTELNNGQTGQSML